MKRLFMILLSVFCCFITISCATDNPPSTESNNSDSSLTDTLTTNILTTETSKTFLSLTLAGNSLDGYTIVYAASPYESLSQEMNLVTDFDCQTATKLQKMLKEYTGIELPVLKDSERTETEKEIRVGKTNRLTEDVPQEFGYRISLSSGNLTICGAEYGVTWHAVDTFLAPLIGGTDMNLEEGYFLEGTFPLTTIACIGDSITYGEHNRMRSYPAFLGFLLWQDYSVINYGHAGTTMRSDLGTPYKNTKAFADCKAADADIYLLMLGTNDSYWDPQWTDTDDQRFLNSCIEILNAVDPDKKAEIFILNCPVYYGSGKYASEQVRTLQEQLPKILVDQGYNAGFFDMYAFTKESLPAKYFPDQIHPTSEGYRIIAEELYKFIIKK